MAGDKPDFKAFATEWLVRAQGHARAPHEASLATELRRVYELGLANAIEAVHIGLGNDGPHGATEGLEEAEDRIRARLGPAVE